ncbi:MAG: TadE/TadG family type IV pilus assembly protein [Chloroflexota bacterium]
MIARRVPAPNRHSERGQSLVEFAVILPLFGLFLLGMLEMGLAFNHYMTLEYASREGSRTGSSLANGGPSNCAGGVDSAGIDQQIVAAVQRILKSPGSPITMSAVSDIRLFRSDASGNQMGSQANLWIYTPGAGPDIDPGVGIDRLDFSQSSNGWPVCSRRYGPTPDSIGVRVRYAYRFQTPLGGIASFFSGAPATLLTMDDKTVMALNPQS